LVSKIKNNDLVSAFLEVLKLEQLMLTIPSTIASVERLFSAMKCIKSYQRSTQNQDRLSSLLIKSFEKELLIKTKKYLNFYDKFTNEFVTKDRRIDFTHE